VRSLGGGSACLLDQPHRHSNIQYVTLSQRHAGLDIEILAAPYGQTKERNPARWSGQVRYRERENEILLNQAKKHEIIDIEVPVELVT